MPKNWIVVGGDFWPKTCLIVEVTVAHHVCDMKKILAPIFSKIVILLILPMKFAPYKVDFTSYPLDVENLHTLENSATVLHPTTDSKLKTYSFFLSARCVWDTLKWRLSKCNVQKKTVPSKGYKKPSIIEKNKTYQGDTFNKQ